VPFLKYKYLKLKLREF